MIIRAEKKSNYTILPNEFLLDETISDKARGMLARLLSRPDNWNLNINHLVKTGKEGHTAIRSAIKELEDAGYIQRDVSRHENGRIVGVEYIIRENPVKSCGDRPAPEQRANSCDETKVQEVREVQAELFDETTLPVPVPAPEKTTLPVQAPMNPEPKPQAQEIHNQVADITDNHMRKTVIKETAPIIKTDIKQILRVTTTTTPEAAPEATPEPVICDQAMPLLPSSCPSNEILNLIPEKHKSPMVLSLVNKAMVDYPAREVEEAIAYAGANVRGGSMQFKAYLDKTLKNGWSAGYFDSMQEPSFNRGYGGSAWIHPMAKYPNGTVTGDPRMDTNYLVAADFLMDMGVDVDQMCAEA